MDSAEQELQKFLDSLPEWRRKWLFHQDPFSSQWLSEGHVEKLSKDSPEQFKAMMEQLALWKDNFADDGPIRERYETLLQENPSRWREYRNKLKREALSYVPKGKPGRKPERKLAERIWKLHAEGKSVPEMQRIFRAEGKNYSREAIEAYLKTRRKK